MQYRFNYQFCLMLGLAGSTTQPLAQVAVRLSPSDEWCLDIYKAYSEGRAYSDTGKLKILRGGAYYCPSSILRSACRAEAQKSDYRWILGGFRVVLAPPFDQVEN